MDLMIGCVQYKPAASEDAPYSPEDEEPYDPEESDYGPGGMYA